MCYQIPDELILAGRKVLIEPLPVVEGEAIALSPENSMPVSTGHIRGYVAYWELIDNELYLNGLEGCYQLKLDHPVSADWFNGIISPAAGIYGEHFAIHVKDGRVVNVEDGE